MIFTLLRAMNLLPRCRQFGPLVNVQQLVLQHKLAKFICPRITSYNFLDPVLKIPQPLGNLSKLHLDVAVAIG